MFEKLFNAIFTKNIMNNITVLSEKREMNKSFNNLKPTAQTGEVKGDAFWLERGKIYGALFKAMEDRGF